MLRLLSLLLPGLIPSWEFFKAVEPSPRIQWRLLDASRFEQARWQEYRPRPAQVSAAALLGRLFWNPRWNEALYVVSLAERLTLNPSKHSTDEINRHLAAEIDKLRSVEPGSSFQFQLVFVSQEPAGLVQTITHVSEPCAFGDIA